jgi:hypothetical protein
MGTCRQCGRPLCSLCVYFRDGQILCAADNAGAGSPAAPSSDVTTGAVPDPIQGWPVATPPTNIDHLIPAPIWAGDPRLEPLPMAMRPGWTDEPLEPRRSGNAETFGLVGLIAALVALPFGFCCGVGGVIGVPLALIAGGLCIAALVLAPRGRNPASARWMGGVGLGFAALTLVVSLCFLAVTFGGLGTSLFSIATP